MLWHQGGRSRHVDPVWTRPDTGARSTHSHQAQRHPAVMVLLGSYPVVRGREIGDGGGRRCFAVRIVRPHRSGKRDPRIWWCSSGAKRSAPRWWLHRSSPHPLSLSKRRQKTVQLRSGIVHVLPRISGGNVFTTHCG
eukprot:gene16186-biopygen21774